MDWGLKITDIQRTFADVQLGKQFDMGMMISKSFYMRRIKQGVKDKGIRSMTFVDVSNGSNEDKNGSCYRHSETIEAVKRYHELKKQGMEVQILTFLLHNRKI